MGCILPGSLVHGILHARILEWVAISFSRESSRHRDQTQVSCVTGRFFTNWATRETCSKFSSEQLCWSPAPAARDSTWRGERCRWVMRQPLRFLGLPIYFKFRILFYKNSRSEVWHFQFPLSQIYYLPKLLLLFKQSSCFSDSLRISLIIYYLPPLMCPIGNLWLHCNSCYIPQFTIYLPKSCLPLTSSLSLKKASSYSVSKIPNFYKL